MISVKVKNKNGIIGCVSVEHWANPEIFLMDFAVAENGKDQNGEKVFAGDFWPEYRDSLKYLDIEED